MNVNEWKVKLDNKYIYLQTQIKNIRESPLYKGMNHLIDHYNSTGESYMAYKLSETLEAETNISSLRMELNNLYYDRLTWLAVYTNNNDILSNITAGDYYHWLAYKIIHENYQGEEISNISNNRINYTC